MFTNIVLAGSQLKGIAYIGVIKALEELKLIKNLKNICGVSSGSIFGLALFLELNYKSLENLIMKVLNYKNIKTTNKINIANILEYYGVENGANIQKIIEIILEKKTGNRKCTFKQLSELFPGKKFIVGGTNLTENKAEYFSIDTTPDMEVIKAIRISISVPLVFTKVTYNDCIYVDGGVTCNFPIDYFKDDMENTLGICVSSVKYMSDISSFETYMARIFRALLDSADAYIINRYRDNIIEILVDYNYMTVDIEDNKKNYLIDSGHEQFLRNIKKTIFKDSVIMRKVLNDIILNIEKNNIN